LRASPKVITWDRCLLAERTVNNDSNEEYKMSEFPKNYSKFSNYPMSQVINEEESKYEKDESSVTSKIHYSNNEDQEGECDQQSESHSEEIEEIMCD
jgi:hypothetical protein